jgi:hypothetical protein
MNVVRKDGKPNSNNMNHSGTLMYQLNSVNQLIFVMVKCSVLFEVRTEFLNTI